MRFAGLKSTMRSWFRRVLPSDHSVVARTRGPQIHVIILDGTMSSLSQGMATNAGRTYKLLQEMGPQLSLYYEAGVQLAQWRNAPDVLMGRGINRQIRRAYGYLASRYKPGDKIFLMGYSRGAFAVRSLAGVIDRVGLLEAKHATVRNIRQAYRHYECSPDSTSSQDFAELFCHKNVEIEMIGVWDTVKALGLRLPILWRWAEAKHSFHNHHLGKSVKHGFHAVALDETREVFTPVMWECDDGWLGKAEQVWFRGSHGDVGGHLDGVEEARPLANIPLVWMLGRAQACGLPLPSAWHLRYPMDVNAPSVGTWHGWGKIFLLRKSRVVGQDKSERIHETVLEHQPEEDTRHWWSFRRHA